MQKSVPTLKRTLQSWKGSQLALKCYRMMNRQQTIRANYVLNWLAVELQSVRTIN